jgi:hypothetical protein
MAQVAEGDMAESLEDALVTARVAGDVKADHRTLNPI